MSDPVKQAKELLAPPPCTECGGDHSSIMNYEIRCMLADLVPDLVAEIERLRAGLEAISTHSKLQIIGTQQRGDMIQTQKWLDILLTVKPLVGES